MAEPYRLTWDETWMRVADDIARRSPCARRQIGAVIVSRHNRVVSTGYNGAPAGFKPAQIARDCTRWCARSSGGQTTAGLSYGLSCPSIHAEANAFLFADRRDFEGGTIYVTSACCQDCGKLVANSGLARVVMRLDERDMHRDPGATIDFIRECGLEVRTV